MLKMSFIGICIYIGIVTLGVLMAVISESKEQGCVDCYMPVRRHVSDMRTTLGLALSPTDLLSY